MTGALYRETFGEGPDLLLVHGWGMHGGVWGEFAERLARHFRVTAVDLPGHGHSPLVDDNGLAGWAEAILGVAPERAHWLGWSLGAQIALYAAASHPGRVGRLLLLAGNPCFVARPDWPAAMAPEAFAAFSSLVEREGADALPRFLALQAQGAQRSRSLLKHTQALLGRRPAPSCAALDAGLALLRDTDLRPQLAGLSCPSMAVFGANDALVPKAAGAALRQLHPALRVVVLPDAAHAPFLSQPEDCACLATEFFGHADA